jgi:predicted branched-subunit amino acid permease
LASKIYFFRGIRDAVGIPSIVLMCSLVGVGGLTRDIGYPIWAGVLSTVLIWAGPAQVLLFGSLAVGTPPTAIALAIFLSSSRFLPMTVSLMPLLRGPHTSIFRLLIAAHLVAVTNWTEGMRRLPGLSVEARYPYYLGFGLTTIAAATFATGAGFYLIGAVPQVFAAALLFTTPMFFTASLVAGTRDMAGAVALVLGFGLGPLVVPIVGPSFDLLADGLLGGTAAWLLGRWQSGGRKGADEAPGEKS